MKLPLRQVAEQLLAVVPDTSQGRCDHEIYEKGEFVVGIAGPRPTVLDRWAEIVREEAEVKFDWHMFGGRAAFRFLGDYAERQRVLAAIHRTLPALEWVYHLRCEDEGSLSTSLYVYWPGS